MKLSLLIWVFSLFAEAYVPNTRMILSRTVENSGSGGYQIEKEVKFSNPEIPVLKESWNLENERTLRLTVVPVGPKPAPKLTILWSGGQRHLLLGGTKETTRPSAENAERLFHFRTTDNFVQYLHQQSILQATSGNLDLARLNRAQGVVTWGLGKITEEGSDRLAPYLWIEQDRFVIRKVRFASKSELTADSFQVYAKGLHYPDVVTLAWDDQKVRLTTQSVSQKKFTPPFFQASQIEDSQEFMRLMAKWPVVSDFYKRFR